MPKQYEAPELTLIGRTQDVILGPPNGGLDMLGDGASDFEFEQD
jgi:hypothetical protein